MAQDNGPAWLIVLVAGIAVVGMALSGSTFYTHSTFGGMMGGNGGGMMDGTSGTPGAGPGSLEWAILLVSAALFVAALLFWYRSRSPAVADPATTATAPAMAPVPAAPAAPVSAETAAPEPAMGELTLMRLLDEDERRMYLELREHGGSMLQRDIVGLGIFSKAKVTRVLDKLEAKGLVRREAHGMTNRVRLVSPAAK